MSAAARALRDSRAMPRLASAASVLVLALVLACQSGPPEPAHVRIAHFIPDAPSANVCLRPDGTAAFGKPFVGGGLAFASLSTRTDVDAGTYSVRVVPGAATDCSTSLQGLGDIGGVTLGEGGAYTLALVGLLGGTGTGGVALQSYVDDTTPAAAPGAKLRSVHAAPELGPVDVGTISGAFFTALVGNLPYLGTSNPAYVGYASGVSGAVLALANPGTQNVLLQGSPFTVSGGTVNSLFIIGRPSVGSGDQRLRFLLCSDSSSGCTQFP